MMDFYRPVSFTNGSIMARFIRSTCFVCHLLVCGIFCSFLFSLQTSLAQQPAVAEPSGDAGGELVPERIEFNRDVRPILSDNCFACHGPDQNKRAADLRLDTEEGLLGNGDGAGAVVPGDVEASELLRRILSEDESEKMPPAEFGKEISPTQRAILARWIEQGAKWEGHWAFQPLRRDPLPDVADERFSRNPIDRHIYAVLEEKGMQPSPVAAPHTLARRLSFDLTGLPPTPEMISKLSGDPSLESYERLVDELIASPHFGERMAIWWLDLVRYADSAGYHGDQPVSVAPFRDYVIQSFNENKSFDQFTIEQLAGDLLPERTDTQWIASGYNRLGMMSAEGGVQPKEYLAKYIAERVRNLSGAWLGVTIGCAECHDHKYDPFSAKEFYQLEAFFADIQEQGLYDAGRKDEPWGPALKVPNESQRNELAELQADIDKLHEVLNTSTPALVEAQRNWERSAAGWQVLQPSRIESLHGVQFDMRPDGSILVSGENPATDTYSLYLSGLPEGTTGLRLEVLPHESLPNRGPGRAGNGNFVLSEIELYVADGEQPVPLTAASASYEQTGAAGGNPYGKWAVAAAIDRDEKGPTWGWAIMEEAGKANNAVFQWAAETPLPTNQPVKIVLKQNLDNPHHTLGHFRLWSTTKPGPLDAKAILPEELEAALRLAETERSEAQRSAIAVHYRSIAPELASTREEIKLLKQRLENLQNAIPSTLVTKTVSPRTIRVLPRGNWMDETGEVVEPSVPVWLGAPLDRAERLTRLDLAKWVVDPNNPLTSRALTNRLWKQFFGVGLSRSLDDLGAQGEWPSHPELLDFLAADWIDSGWNLKRLVKTMVMSETYRQSSIATAADMERDPYNRWLARQGRWRLEAEMVRDNALAISGLLVDTIGGESVKPFQPPGYWAYLNFPQREWQASAGRDLYRRGVYTHWQRQYLHPALLAFDAPNREECAADRPRSNTPLQALVLLNDPCFVEAARVFAQRVLTADAKSDADRIEWAVLQSVGRIVRPEERDLLLNLLQRQREEYASHPELVDALLKIGSAPVPEGLDRTEIAVFTGLTRTLLNLHETITRN